MLGVQDEKMESAAEKLVNLGFVRETWSFGSTIDPATRQNDERFQLVHERRRPAFAAFDAKTIRFHCLDKLKYVQQTVLIPSSYMHLSASDTSIYTSNCGFAILNTSRQPPFYVHDNLYYPNLIVLIQSIIKVCLEERARTSIRAWQLTLESWAIGYLYQELSLREDVLDTCQDTAVKEFFNMKIKRGSTTSGIREKWGKPKAIITNDLIKDFQTSPGCIEEVAKIGQITIGIEERENHEDKKNG